MCRSLWGLGLHQPCFVPCSVSTATLTPLSRLNWVGCAHPCYNLSLCLVAVSNPAASSAVPGCSSAPKCFAWLCRRVPEPLGSGGAGVCLKVSLCFGKGWLGAAECSVEVASAVPAPGSVLPLTAASALKALGLSGPSRRRLQTSLVQRVAL